MWSSRLPLYGVRKGYTVCLDGRWPGSGERCVDGEEMPEVRQLWYRSDWGRARSIVVFVVSKDFVCWCEVWAWNEHLECRPVVANGRICGKGARGLAVKNVFAKLGTQHKFIPRTSLPHVSSIYPEK
jgi:hypothetical protein